jgi:hypothetical protein
LSQLRGARGYYSNRFPPGAEAWLRNLVNKGIECGHFCYLFHDEAASATIQPVTLQLKPKLRPSDPDKFRTIFDMAATLISSSGESIPSIIASMDYHMVPSPMLGYPSRIVSMLAHLAEGKTLAQRSLIHAAKFDLDQAYYSVWVNKVDQSLLAFRLGEDTVAHAGLPFGSNLSSATFLRPILLLWKFLLLITHILISWYVDDAFLCALTYNECVRDMSKVDAVITWAGFKKATSKSSLVPEQRLTQLGLVWDIPSWTVSIKPELIEKVSRLLIALRGRDTKNVIQRRNRLRLIHDLQSLVGCLGFIQQVIRIIAAPKSFFLWQLHRLELKDSTCFQLPREYLEVVSTTLLLLQTHNSAPILCEELELANTHKHLAASDASGLGFGAWGLDCEGAIHAFGGEWTSLSHPDASTLHSNDRELWAHLMMIDKLLPHILPSAKFIILESDNMAVVSWASSLSCHQTKDGGHIRRTHWLSHSGLLQASRQQRVQCKHLPGSLNQFADRASRGVAKFDSLVLEWRASGLTVHVHSIEQAWHPSSMWMPI